MSAPAERPFTDCEADEPERVVRFTQSGRTINAAAFIAIVALGVPAVTLIAWWAARAIWAVWA